MVASRGRRPPLRLCEDCGIRSAVYVISESIDGRTDRYLTCSRCVGARALLWERFAVVVHIARIDVDEYGNDETGE